MCRRCECPTYRKLRSYRSSNGTHYRRACPRRLPSTTRREQLVIYNSCRLARPPALLLLVRTSATTRPAHHDAASHSGPPPRLPPPPPLASLPEAVPFLPFPMPSPPLALLPPPNEPTGHRRRLRDHDRHRGSRASPGARRRCSRSVLLAPMSQPPIRDG